MDVRKDGVCVPESSSSEATPHALLRSAKHAG